MKLIDWYNDFRYFLKSIIIGIKNLWVWFPVIWKDRNFDKGYLIELNIKKLEMMHKWFSNPNNTHITEENRKHIVSRINTAIKLMKLVEDEFYAMEYQKEIENLYGKSKWEFIPCHDMKNMYEIQIKFEKKYTEEELEKINKHEHELLVKSRNKHIKAKRILWKFIEHNIDYWWD